MLASFEQALMVYLSFSYIILLYFIFQTFQRGVILIHSGFELFGNAFIYPG